MKSNTWLPFYPGDYLRDTGHLTTVEHGAYFLLLLYGFTQGGLLPADHNRLRILTKMSVEEWEVSGPTLVEFFYLTEKGYRQKRLDREIKIASANVEQRRAAGRASASKRALQRNTQREFNERSNGHVNGNSTSVATSVSTGHPTNGQRKPNPSPSPVIELDLGVGDRGVQGGEAATPSAQPTPTKSKRKPKATSARTQVDPEFYPEVRGCEVFEECGLPDSDLEPLVKRFTEYHQANGTLMADWHAAWAMWCRNEQKFRTQAQARK